jgi:hypothetical protein
MPRYFRKRVNLPASSQRQFPRRGGTPDQVEEVEKWKSGKATLEVGGTSTFQLFTLPRLSN